MSYALTTTVHHSFADTLDATRVSPTDQGFGVLTEIDIQAPRMTWAGMSTFSLALRPIPIT